MPKPKPTTAGPEAELVGLVATRTTLQARQVALTVEVKQAVAARRALLIEGGAAAAVADAERTCREIEGTAFGVADALMEVERRIVDAEARIEAARVTAGREAVAGDLERNAAEIEKATAGLAKAIGDVVKAHASLTGAIGDRAAAQFDPARGIASPAGIADALMLQGLAAGLPNLDVRADIRPWSPYSMIERVEAADPLGIATEYGQRLREVAGKVRSGEMDRDLPAHHEPQPDFSPNSDETEIFVLAPFRYLRAANDLVMVTSSRTRVPAPVAERAIDLGLATDRETQEWRAAHYDGGPLANPPIRIDREDCADIEFDLATWRKAEADRRRSAWLAEQRPAA